MKIYGIFGDPIGHSLSPAMHSAAFEVMGLEACYHAFLVQKGSLRDAVLGAKAMGFGGLNLTIPLKEEALRVVQPDDLALAIGAVNTVSFCHGISGHNTDGLGAKKALEEAGAAIRGRRVLIIGAGGAARALAYTLARDGAYVSIANRSRARAADLAGHVGGSAFGLDELERLGPGADIIINATSVGMKDGDPRVLDGELLRRGQMVFDIVYNRETELLKDAARAGAGTLDGVMMLVYQGAEAIRIWTGRDAPADAMEQAVRKALAARARGQA